METCFVFDIDDTVVEYVDFDYAEWFRCVAMPAAEEVGIEMNLEIWGSMTSGTISRRYPEKFGVPAKKFWKEVDKYNLQFRKKMWAAERIRLYEDAQIIPTLRGKKIAWSAASEECVRFVLNALGILGWFDAVYGKDFGDYAHLDELKPKPGFLQLILRRENCSSCVVVGDSQKDMLAARGAGCRAMLVDRKSGIDIRSLLTH